MSLFDFNNKQDLGEFSSFLMLMYVFNRIESQIPDIKNSACPQNWAVECYHGFGFYTFVYFVFVYVCGHTHASVCLQGSEDNLQELVLSYHVGSWDQSQVIWFSNRCLYPLSHLSNLPCSFVHLQWCTLNAKQISLINFQVSHSISLPFIWRRVAHLTSPSHTYIYVQNERNVRERQCYREFR